MTIKDIQYTPLNKKDELVCSYDFVDKKGNKQVAWYGLKSYGIQTEWTPKLKEEAYQALLRGVKKHNELI